MGKLREIKEFYNRQFELRNEWDEPYRSRVEKCLNTARRAGYVAIGIGVAYVIGEPILSAVGVQEAADVANDVLIGDVAGYMALNLSCVARIAFLERQQADHRQQVA